MPMHRRQQQRVTRPSQKQLGVRPSPGSALGERVGYTDFERGRWLLEFGSRAMAAFTPDEVTSLQLELEWFLRRALSERRRDEKSVAAITQSTLLVSERDVRNWGAWVRAGVDQIKEARPWIIR